MDRREGDGDVFAERDTCLTRIHRGLGKGVRVGARVTRGSAMRHLWQGRGFRYRASDDGARGGCLGNMGWSSTPG